MCFFVQRHAEGKIKSALWRNRCGALHFAGTDAFSNQPFNYFIIGVHAPHHDLEDFYADVAFLYHQRPRGARVAIIGDWNADLLPDSPDDPFHSTPSRSQHHQQQRQLVKAFAEAVKCQIAVPIASQVPAGGSYGELTTRHPITRIPIGRSADTHVPSFLDYAMAQRYTVGEGQILWQGVTSDHAMVSYPLIGAHSFIQIPRTRWRCLDAEAAASWTLKNCPNGFEDVFALMDFAQTLQDHYIDDRPRKQRRAQRQNFQQRSLQRRIAECTDDFERRHLIRTAKGIHNIVHATEQRRQDHAAARRGSGINHKKHLHKVEAVLLTEENHAG